MELGILQKGLLNRLWQLHQDEVFSRVQIILTTFVYNSEVSLCLGVFIGEHPVDLMQL